MAGDPTWDDPELEEKRFPDFDPLRKIEGPSEEQQAQIAQGFETDPDVRTTCPFCTEDLRGPMDELREHLETCQTEFLSHMPKPEPLTLDPREVALQGCGEIRCETCGRRIRGTWTKYQNHLRVCSGGRP